MLMGRLQPKDAAMAAPKRQPGAYISREGKYLYRVIGTPAGSSMLRVENAMTGHEINLTKFDVETANLVRAAPRLDVPDRLPVDIAA
jgi:hypothetical protein